MRRLVAVAFCELEEHYRPLHTSCSFECSDKRIVKSPLHKLQRGLFSAKILQKGKRNQLFRGGSGPTAHTPGGRSPPPPEDWQCGGGWGARSRRHHGTEPVGHPAGGCPQQHRVYIQNYYTHLTALPSHHINYPLDF